MPLIRPCMQAATMQVLQLLLPLLLALAPVSILLVVRRATPPPIKARLATLKSAIARARKPIIFVTDFATAHHLLVRGSRSTTAAAAAGGSFSNRPPSMAPSAVLSGRRYHNINSAPYGQLWRALRYNLTSGVLHPTHLHRYAAARRHALRGLVADLSEQQQVAAGVVLAAESIRSAVFGLVSTMCFGDGVDAGVVRAMADVQTELVLSLSTVRTFVFVPFLAVSKLIYRKRWNKLAAIRQKQEELYLTLIDGCRRHRRDSADETPPTYVHTLIDLQVPVEELDKQNSVGGEDRQQQRRLKDGELVGLCSEFLGSSTESVSASLQWIMANLMKRPDMQEAIRKEVDAAVDADAEEVGEEVLGKLDYLNAVILEALRLHPTTKLAFRQVKAPIRGMQEFLGSGTESLSAALQWIMANLMKRPDMQEAIRREIDAVVGANEEEVGEEVLGKLDHLNTVILEALRLHPTTMWVFRQVSQVLIVL